jgi:hypothetical protein
LSQNAAPPEHLSPAGQLSTALKLTETGIPIKPTLAFRHFSLDPKRPGQFLRGFLMPIPGASSWRQFLNRAWLDPQVPFLL